MARWTHWLALACFLIASQPGAGEDLAGGKLLVAARAVQGGPFGESVILLLQYGMDTGAVGLIINRPMTVPLRDVLPQLQGLAQYRGPVYLGGPVEMDTVRALVLAETPPVPSLNIFGHVHLVPPEKATSAGHPADASSLRFYVGYAGWAPGQLENEVARGDWHIRSATTDLVFAEDPGRVWRELVPAPLYHASNGGTR